MDLRNYREFFENIQLDENGNIMCILQSDEGVTLEKGVSMYNTYKKLELTNDGYIKITISNND